MPIKSQATPAVGAREGEAAPPERPTAVADGSAGGDAAGNGHVAGGGGPSAAHVGLVRSGLTPLDDRLGGLRSGGTYLLAGLPGSGRFAALLQFLAAGLEEGRAGLITAAPRQRVFEEARHWGLELEGAWAEGRLRLISYRPDFQRLLISAADPGSVLEEMQELLGPDIRRLGIHPAAPLWETRAGTALASEVVSWLDSFGATTLGTVGGDLEGERTAASEWVLDAVTGLFLLERLPTGLRQLWVRRMSPPIEDPGPITLELTPGTGYTAPTGRLDRRRSDQSLEGNRRVLLIRLEEEVPSELSAWLDRWYETTSVRAPFEAVERVQEDRFGLVLVYLSRRTVDEALQAVRALRGLASAPILLATADRVRSADRIRALEGGASDFLSEPLSVGELASRAERAMIAGPPAPVRSSGLEEAEPAASAGADASAKRPPAGTGALGEEASFSDRVRARLSSPRGSLCVFIRIPAPAHLEGTKVLRQALQQEIRDEDGDAVGEVPGGIGVLLHGTEVARANGFLDRVRRHFGSGTGEFPAEVLSGTVDRERIRALLEAEGA